MPDTETASVDLTPAQGRRFPCPKSAEHKSPVRKDRAFSLFSPANGFDQPNDPPDRPCRTAHCQHQPQVDRQNDKSENDVSGTDHRSEDHDDRHDQQNHHRDQAHRTGLDQKAKYQLNGKQPKKVKSSRIGPRFTSPIQKSIIETPPFSFCLKNLFSASTVTVLRPFINGKSPIRKDRAFVVLICAFR